MILAPKDYVIVALAATLVVSGIGNLWLFGERDNALAAATEANAALTTANAAGETCDASVKRLQEDAKDAAKVHAPKVEAAAVRNTAHTHKAQTILATPATRPDNVCLSAQDRAAAWLKDRP